MSDNITSQNFDPYSFLTVPAFEASSTNYRNQAKTAILGDADAIAIGELTFIQSRCRHLIRNNPIASAARDKHVTNSGYIHVKWENGSGETHSLMQELWDEFYQNCTLDNKGNLDTVQATWHGDRFESGEAFGRMIISKKFNDNRIPLKLQSIESEYLDISFMGQQGDEIMPFGRTRYGITFDKDTLLRPETYNFYKNRYFGLLPPIDGFHRVPVPASDILHMFERKRSNQWRGTPLLAPCLISLYELEDLSTATVRAQTSASAISWVVDNANNLSLDPLGTTQLLGTKYKDDSNQTLTFSSEGGTVQYTSGKINLMQSRDIGSNLVALLQEEYQKIAACLNLPFHELSGDLSGLNFSSIRGILTQQRRRIEFLYNIIDIPDGIKPLCKRFKDIAVALGYEVSDATPTYQFPRWYGVDDLKDAQADLLEVVSGFTPIEAIWAERGYSKEQIEKSLEVIRQLGLDGLMNKQQNPAQNNQQPTSATTGS